MDAKTVSDAQDDAALLALPLCEVEPWGVHVGEPREERLEEIFEVAVCVAEGDADGCSEAVALAETRDDTVGGSEVEGEALACREGVGCRGERVAAGAEGVEGGVLLPGSCVPLCGMLNEGSALRLCEAQDVPVTEGGGEADAEGGGVLEGEAEGDGSAVGLPPPRAESSDGETVTLTVACCGVPLPAAVAVSATGLGEGAPLALPADEGEPLPLRLKDVDTEGSGERETEGVWQGKADEVGEGGGVNVRAGEPLRCGESDEEA